MLKSFRSTFVHIFSPKMPFQTDQHLTWAEEIFSNLLGGLRYYHGTAKVDTSKKAIYAETTANFWEKSKEAKEHATPEIKGPYELLTHTPSRATLPRGFLWHEGFHLLPVLEWDADLALGVVRSWLALMDDDGWIAREQVLGVESQSSTPKDFVTQYPHIATPPTMFLVVSKFIDMLDGKVKYYGHKSLYLSQAKAGEALVAELYPKLQKQYEWFRISQSGDVEAHSLPSANLNEGYRWRGRTPEYNFASRLDDYPRAEPPDISELHLDALCWVGVMAQTLERIAVFILAPRDMATYQNHLRNVKKNLEIVHWEQKQNVYCDTVMQNSVHTYVCHKGYISIFPFLTGHMNPDHPNLPAVLDLLHDPEHLWTPYGIRSLSPESEDYGVGNSNWRSPIWVNINYMAIEQLLHLTKSTGPSQQRCREIYIELRSNIVHTVFNSWIQTGNVWEQYNPMGGHGQRTQHFTGWTALVVKIMAMPHLERDEGVKEKVDKVKEKVGEYYEEAKEQVVQNQRTSAGGIVFAIMLIGFVWVTRRRFAGTLRGWRRTV